jgi:TPR repeat protein
MTKAAQTMPEAKYALAVWIERGYFGEPDTKKAVALYEQAATCGIKNAVKSLISIYHGGFGGFPKNIEREQYWRARLK